MQTFDTFLKKSIYRCFVCKLSYFLFIFSPFSKYSEKKIFHRWKYSIKYDALHFLKSNNLWKIYKKSTPFDYNYSYLSTYIYLGTTKFLARYMDAHLATRMYLVTTYCQMLNKTIAYNPIFTYYQMLSKTIDDNILMLTLALAFI